MALPSTLELPRLESGDRLDRAEFHRRYLALPDVQAELVEGIVYVASPLRMDGHGLQHAQLVGWLSFYTSATPGLQLGDNVSFLVDDRNEVQPDALLRIDRPLGRSRLTQDSYVVGAPELVAEVAASSVSIDLHAKRRIYERSGVQEYLVWRTLEQRIDWWQLEDGSYQSIRPDASGRIRSSVLPGLILDSAALLAADLAGVIDLQRAELASVAHAQFVDRLDE